MVTLTPHLAQLIVDHIRASLGKDVCIADQAGRVLAGSRAAEGQVQVPLVYRGDLLGSVIINDSPENGRMYSRLVAALAELLVHQASERTEQAAGDELRDAFVYRLLTGQTRAPDEQVLRQAEVLGIDLRPPRAAIAVKIQRRPTPAAVEDAAWDRRSPYLRHQLVSAAERFFSLASGAVVAYAGEDELAVLVRADPKWLPEEAKRRLLSAADGVRQTIALVLDPGAVTAGVGRHHPNLTGLAASYGEARVALEVGVRLHGAGDTYHPEDLAVALLVHEAPRELREQLAERILAPLEQHPELLATVEAFLANELSPSRTSSALSLHRSSLHYRLDQVCRITGLDPRRFSHAVQIYLALLARRLDV